MQLCYINVIFTPSSYLCSTPSSYHVVHPPPTPTHPLVIITPTAPPNPTSIPSSSSIPPSETVTPSADPDLAGDGDDVDPPLHDRPWIEPYGKGFIPSRVASQTITRSIKQQYLNPWPTWGAIPIDNRKPFSERFTMKEEFSTRLSQIRSEHGSAPTPDDATNEDDDIRRTQCWVDVVGGKKKGRVYDVGQLAANYTISRGGTLKHQPSSSTTTAEETIERLTQLLQKRDQENHDLRENYNDLRTEFTNFKSLVMRALPDASDIHSTVPLTQPRPSLSLVVPQQPTPVQPTPIQPSTEQQDDEDHSNDDYVDF
ncbi:hypothetical protein LR48_Vigan11g132300 [Vigna angularis]|uniref:Uncharacterized protein n=1 Tax=Phaseolus angularis TaxID=3914 RepID=A0A0L9VU42_PHAAN|nr:hypothetical protein LR48_Vigan11g132300 [Vigna angularis]